jgi:hypothetical protein
MSVGDQWPVPLVDGSRLCEDDQTHIPLCLRKSHASVRSVNLITTVLYTDHFLRTATLVRMKGTGKTY